MPVSIEITWWAAGLAALVYFALGALWFTPLFGRAWDEAIGKSRADDGRFPAAYYVVPLVSSVLVSLAMSLVVAAVAPDGIVAAFSLGVVIGAGIGLAISVTNALTPHTPHPFRHGFITGGYHLVGITVVTVILGAFS